jgi:hypothetical protein
MGLDRMFGELRGYFASFAVTSYWFRTRFLLTSKGQLAILNIEKSIIRWGHYDDRS